MIEVIKKIPIGAKNCLHSQTTFFDSPFWLPAALNDYNTFEYYSTMWYFFPATFLYFWVMCLFSLNCSDSMECLCTPLRLKNKKKELLFWEIHHFLPRTCGCEDGSCLLTTWQSEKCLRTIRRQWDSGGRGQSIWGQAHREIHPNRLYQNAFPGRISYFCHLLE